MFIFKKKKILISIFFFILFLCICLYAYSKINLNESKELIDVIHQNIKENKEINFDKMIDFAWDEMFIIGPYEDPQDAFQKENLKWRKINTSIYTNESIYLIIFLKDKEVVSYVNYPRGKGSFQKGGIYKRNSTRFIVERSQSSDWIYLIHSEKLFMDESKSSFSSFEIKEEKVYMYTSVTIVNQYNRDIKFRVNAKSQEDKENGLLKTEKLFGFDKNSMEKDFFIEENATANYEIVFIGESDGGDSKSNRTLPQIVIEEIQ